MKRLFLPLFAAFSINTYAFEIYALGTSNTNCKDVAREASFTVVLEKLLRTDGFDVQVINGGINGDKPFFMVDRMDREIKPATKLVIFEPGPNDKNKSSNLDYSAKILETLQKAGMPTIYVSVRAIQSEADAKVFAEKFGAFYYGHYNHGVPTDFSYRTADWHLTGLGCTMWAEQMHPLVKSVLEAKGIK